MTPPFFTIAVPNFNYAGYLGETLTSALGQDWDDLEVVVADNASTDDSVEVLASFDDPRLEWSVNPCNVGFAANLDRAVAAGTGRHVILLSSDDVLRPGALRRYAEVLATLGEQAASSVVSAAYETIDADGRVTSRLSPSNGVVWRGVLPDRSGCLELAPPELLRRSLSQMRNPLPFASTCFPRVLWHRVGGYRSSRHVNPDKWFHWRLVEAAQRVLLIDDPLVGYRVHGHNQTAQQSANGALKYVCDEYAATFEVPEPMLRAAGLTRDELVDAFLRHDVILRAWAAIAEGQRAEARRLVRFARAVYPGRAGRQPLLGAAWLAAHGGRMSSRAASRLAGWVG
jgi:glycosyltransferase involved in cell wall biosynthesis